MSAFDPKRALAGAPRGKALRLCQKTISLIKW